MDPISSWFTRSCMKSHERTFAKVDKTVHDSIFEGFDRGIVILSVFMVPDRIVLPASRNKSHRKLLTCFSWRAPLGLSFREHKRRNDQICPFSFKDIILLTVDPNRVISNHHDSSRVGSCQLSSLLGGFCRFHFG